MLEGCHGGTAAAPPLVPPVLTQLQTREHELEAEVQRLTAELAESSATSRTSGLLASARLNMLEAEARGLEAGQGKGANDKGHALGGGGGGGNGCKIMAMSEEIAWELGVSPHTLAVRTNAAAIKCTQSDLALC